MRLRTGALPGWIVSFGLGCAPPPASGTPPLTSVLVASGLDRPLFVTHVRGDFGRIFIVEQAGRIRILDRTTGSVLATPFLDISTKVACCGERGLLGLAFHPDYAVNGWFFVNYTNLAEDTVVARYQVSADPNVAAIGSEEIILTIGQPFPNHNGGWIAFGPDDGYLYIATGDGGGIADPAGRAQRIDNELLGKILRIDVDGGSPFAIPPDNPFVGVSGSDEIWAYGLRNPWRCAFDRTTGDLYVADVGEATIEEVDFQPAASGGGENYGWKCREGHECFDPTCCNDAGFVDPIHTYDHNAPFFSCSITGGEVYRGCAIPGLEGTYFFADFCSGQIWSLRFNGSVVDFQNRTAELAPSAGLDLSSISSFGTDAAGELYLCDLGDGEVFQIVADTATPVHDCNANSREDACDLLTGDSADDNANAVPDECEIPVPALSGWGMVALGASLLLAGVAVTANRRWRATVR